MIPVAGMAVGNFLWHAVKRTASVLFVLGLFWGLYVMAVKPHINPTPTESQRADNITNFNYTLEPKQTFFGCQNFKIAKPNNDPIPQNPKDNK